METQDKPDIRLTLQPEPDLESKLNNHHVKRQTRSILHASGHLCLPKSCSTFSRLPALQFGGAGAFAWRAFRRGRCTFRVEGIGFRGKGSRVSVLETFHCRVTTEVRVVVVIALILASMRNFRVII